jgi:hypothetical protein
MDAAWGKEYRRGRYMHKLIGYPVAANVGIKLLDNARVRDTLLKAAYRKAEGPQHRY